MSPDIGPILREARMRRQIELEEVERQTKIRSRFLRALENEEWGILPGGAYTRGFIRTYASFLGLDGERLADEFRRDHQDGDARPTRPEPLTSPGRPLGERRRWRIHIGTGPAAILISAALIGLLLVLGLTGGSQKTPTPRPTHARTQPQAQPQPQAPAQPQPPATHSLALKATADVWVCLVDQNGTKLVNGKTLSAGQKVGPFRSKIFQLTLGNGHVALALDGKGISVPDSSNPINYLVKQGQARPSTGTQLPTCA